MLHMSGSGKIVAEGASRRNLGNTMPPFRSGILTTRIRSLRGIARFTYLSNSIPHVPGAIPLPWCLRLPRLTPHAVPKNSAAPAPEGSSDAADREAALRAAMQLEARLEAELQRLQAEGLQEAEGASEGATESGGAADVNARHLMRESRVLRRKSELLEAMVGALRERLHREEERSINLAGEVEAGRAQLAVSEGTRRQLGSTIADLRTELADTQSQLAQALQLSPDLEQRVVRLSQRNTVLALRVGELEEGLGQAEEEAAAAAAETRNRIRKLEAAAEQDQLEIVELRSSLSAREAQLAVLREAEAELQELLQQSKAAAQQLSATLEARGEELKSSRAAVEEAEAAERRDAEALREQLANQEVTHSEQLTTLRSQKAEIEVAEAAVRQELSEAAAAAKEQQLVVETLRKQLHSAQLSAERASAARVREVSELRSGLEAHLAAARAEAAAARGQLADVSTALQGLLSGHLLREVVEEELHRVAARTRVSTPPIPGPSAAQQVGSPGPIRNNPEEQSLSTRETSLRSQLSSLATQLAELQAAAVARLGPALVARAQQLEAAAAEARKARAAAKAVGDEAAAQRASTSLDSLTAELGALYRLAMSSEARNRERAVQAEMQARELELRGLLERRAHRTAAKELQVAAAAVAQQQHQGQRQAEPPHQTPGPKPDSSAPGGPSAASVQLQRQLRQAVAAKMRELLKEREQQLQQQSAEREAQLRAHLAERLAAGEEAQQREIRAVQQTVEKQVRLLEVAWRGQLEAFTRALSEAAKQREALGSQAAAAAAQVRAQLSELEVLRFELSAARGAVGALQRAAEGSRTEAAQQSEAAGRQVVVLAEQVAALTKQLKEYERQFAATTHVAAKQSERVADTAPAASGATSPISPTILSPSPLPPPSPPTVRPAAVSREQPQQPQKTPLSEARIPRMAPSAGTEGPPSLPRQPSPPPSAISAGQLAAEPSGAQTNRTPNSNPSLSPNPNPSLGGPQPPSPSLTPLRPGWPLQFGGMPGTPVNTPPLNPPAAGEAASPATSPSQQHPGRQLTRPSRQSPLRGNSSSVTVRRADVGMQPQIEDCVALGRSESSIVSSCDGGCSDDMESNSPNINTSWTSVISTDGSNSSSSSVNSSNTGVERGANEGSEVLAVWTRLLADTQASSPPPLPSAETETPGSEETVAEGSDSGTDRTPLSAERDVDEEEGHVAEGSCVAEVDLGPSASGSACESGLGSSSAAPQQVQNSQKGVKQNAATSYMQLPQDAWRMQQQPAPVAGLSAAGLGAPAAAAAAACEGHPSADETEQALVLGSGGKSGEVPARLALPQLSTGTQTKGTPTNPGLAAATPSAQNAARDHSRTSTSNSASSLPSAAAPSNIRQEQPSDVESASTLSDHAPWDGASTPTSTASADSATTTSVSTSPPTSKSASRFSSPPSSPSQSPQRFPDPQRSSTPPKSSTDRTRSSPSSSSNRDAPTPASSAAAGPSPAAAAMAAAAGAAAAAKRAAAAARLPNSSSSSSSCPSFSGASTSALPERLKGFSAPPISEWGRPKPPSPPPAPNSVTQSSTPPAVDSPMTDSDASNAPFADSVLATPRPPSSPSGPSGPFFSEAELGAEIAAIAQSLVARTLAGPPGLGTMNPTSTSTTTSTSPPVSGALSEESAAVNAVTPIIPNTANPADSTSSTTSTSNSNDKPGKGRRVTKSVLRLTSSSSSAAPSSGESLGGLATTAPLAADDDDSGGGRGVAGGDGGERGSSEQPSMQQLTLAVAAAARATSQVQGAQGDTERGSEDAYFLVTPSGSRYPPRPPGRPTPPGAWSVTALGVADGVGGWAEEAVDPGQYAREVCAAAAQAAEESGPGLSDPRHLLSAAQAAVRTMGSCTACVALLAPGSGAGSSRDAVLCVANLGDSGVRVVRRGSLVLASSSQEHAFNMPYQMAHPDNLPETNTAQQAQVYTITLRPGDVIILATDGLYDNMWDEELVSLAAAAAAGLPAGVCGPGAASAASSAASQLAGSLVATAARHAGDPGFRSPWAVELANRPSASWLERLLPRGGRADDITVIVAIATATE